MGLLKKKPPKNRNFGDLSIPVLTAVLAGFGVLAVYSASSYSAKMQYGDSLYFMKKQLIGFLLGLVGMIAVSFFNHQKFRGKRFRWVALLFPMLLLALVFVPGIGKSNYGATRWIGIGGITVQPSELAKYGFVVFVSAYMSERMGEIRTFKGVLPVLLSGGGICALIILEPNMSVTVCVGALMLVMLFLGGMKIRHFFFIALPVLVAVPVLIALEPYRLLRFSAFLNPWASPKEEGYQLIQSLYSLGNGGWFGTGFLRSRQKYRFLPFAESDFILAIIGEEFGFVGVFLLFAVSGVLIWRGICVAVRADDFFSFLLSAGITAVYGIQTVVNALVVSGAIPPTGIPLPLISSGNTSLIITMSSMGVLYGISKHKRVGRGIQ
jgi:cell division protein FtsW